MRNNSPDPYDWQAFCYIHGELDEAETRRWEKLLLDDEQARLAMARMLYLTDSLTAMFSVDSIQAPLRVSGEAVHRRRRRTQRLAVLALALCVIIMAVGWWFLEIRRVSRFATTDNTNLAEAWLATHADRLWSNDPETDADLEEQNVGLDVSLVGSSPVDCVLCSTMSDGAPSWLLLAVAELNGQRAAGDLKAEGRP